MADATDRKLYLGPKLRVLRRELGLNQTRMAEELGFLPAISTIWSATSDR